MIGTGFISGHAHELRIVQTDCSGEMVSIAGDRGLDLMDYDARRDLLVFKRSLEVLYPELAAKIGPMPVRAAIDELNKYTGCDVEITDTAESSLKRFRQRLGISQRRKWWGGA